MTSYRRKTISLHRCSHLSWPKQHSRSIAHGPWQTGGFYVPLTSLHVVYVGLLHNRTLASTWRIAPSGGEKQIDVRYDNKRRHIASLKYNTLRMLIIGKSTFERQTQLFRFVLMVVVLLFQRTDGCLWRCVVLWGCKTNLFIPLSLRYPICLLSLLNIIIAIVLSLNWIHIPI